jgi:RNA polymerase sigma-70 factor (ECF subfamily)
MNSGESFFDVMTRLRAGDQQAASEVFQRFSARLIALARSRLDGYLRRKVDPEDILQSVCKSFFARHAQGQYELGNWDSLWTLLTVLTVRKCANSAQYHRRARRDARKEEARQGAADEAATGWEAVDREPTPEEAAMLSETVERLMRQLDERDREILALSLQGLAPEEISTQVGYAQRTIRRVLAHVRERLQAEAAAAL